MGETTSPNLASLLFDHPAAGDEPLLFGPVRTWEMVPEASTRKVAGSPRIPSSSMDTIAGSRFL